MTEEEKAAKREDYRLNWGERVGVLQNPGAPADGGTEDAMFVDDEVDELESEVELSSDDEPLAKRQRDRSPSQQALEPPAPPRAPAPPTAFSHYRIPRQAPELPTEVLLQAGSSWGAAKSFTAPTPNIGVNPFGQSSSAAPSQQAYPTQPSRLGYPHQPYPVNTYQPSPYHQHTYPQLTSQHSPIQNSPPRPSGGPGPGGIHPDRLAMMASPQPALQPAGYPQAPSHLAHLELVGYSPESATSTQQGGRSLPTTSDQPTIDPRRRLQPGPSTVALTGPVPGPPTSLGRSTGSRFGPQDVVPAELTRSWTVMVVKFMDPDLDMQGVAAVMRGGERRDLPAPAAISFLWSSAMHRNCLVAYEVVEDARAARPGLSGKQVWWLRDGSTARRKFLNVMPATAEEANRDWTWSELNPTVARAFQAKLADAQQARLAPPPARVPTPPLALPPLPQPIVKAAIGPFSAPPTRVSGVLPEPLYADWHQGVVYNLDPRSTRQEIFRLLAHPSLPDPVVLRVRNSSKDDFGQSRIVGLITYESAEVLERAIRLLNGKPISWRQPTRTPELHLRVKPTSARLSALRWDEVNEDRLDDLRARAARPPVPRPPEVLRVWGPRAGESGSQLSVDPRPASQPARDPPSASAMLERGSGASSSAGRSEQHHALTRSDAAPEVGLDLRKPAVWYQMTVYGLDPRWDRQRMLDVVSHPEVPCPVGFKIRTGKKDGFGQPQLMAFVAFETFQAREDAIRLLRGKMVEWDQPTLMPVVELVIRLGKAETSPDEWRDEEIVPLMNRRGPAGQGVGHKRLSEPVKMRTWGTPLEEGEVRSPEMSKTPSSERRDHAGANSGPVMTAPSFPDATPTSIPTGPKAEAEAKVPAEVASGWTVLIVYNIPASWTRDDLIGLLSRSTAPSEPLPRCAAALVRPGSDDAQGRPRVIWFVAYEAQADALRVKDCLISLEPDQIGFQAGEIKLGVRVSDKRRPAIWTQAELVTRDKWDSVRQTQSDSNGHQRRPSLEQRLSPKRSRTISTGPPSPTQSRRQPPSPVAARQLSRPRAPRWAQPAKGLSAGNRVPTLISRQWTVLLVNNLKPAIARAPLCDILQGRHWGLALAPPVAIRFRTVQGHESNRTCVVAYEEARDAWQAMSELQGKKSSQTCSAQGMEVSQAINRSDLEDWAWDWVDLNEIDRLRGPTSSNAIVNQPAPPASSQPSPRPEWPRTQVSPANLDHGRQRVPLSLCQQWTILAIEGLPKGASRTEVCATLSGDGRPFSLSPPLGIRYRHVPEPTRIARTCVVAYESPADARQVHRRLNGEDGPGVVPGERLSVTWAVSGDDLNNWAWDWLHPDRKDYWLDKAAKLSSSVKSAAPTTTASEASRLHSPVLAASPAPLGSPVDAEAETDRLLGSLGAELFAGFGNGDGGPPVVAPAGPLNGEPSGPSGSTDTAAALQEVTRDPRKRPRPQIERATAAADEPPRKIHVHQDSSSTVAHTVASATPAAPAASAASDPSPIQQVNLAPTVSPAPPPSTNALIPTTPPQSADDIISILNPTLPPILTSAPAPVPAASPQPLPSLPPTRSPSPAPIALGVGPIGQPRSDAQHRPTPQPARSSPSPAPSTASTGSTEAAPRRGGLLSGRLGELARRARERMAANGAGGLAQG